MSDSSKIDYLLQHITSLLTRKSDQILLEQLGIGYSQFKILRTVDNKMPVKQRFIAEVLGQSEASITRQVNILNNKNLVTRNMDPRNKRVKLVVITEKGRNLALAAAEVLEKFHLSFDSELSHKEKHELLRVLETYHEKTCVTDHTPDPDYLDFITRK